MSALELFTAFHTGLSLVAIVSGFATISGMLSAKPFDWWTATFLITAIATTATGFFFPSHGFTPAIGVGIVSSIVLALMLVARFTKHLAGGWRRLYAIGAVVSLYFNVFVLIVQSFQKIPVLKALAPTQTETPFAISQLLALIGFVALGVAVTKRFTRAAPAARGTMARL